MSEKRTPWLPVMEKDAKPLYVEIAEAIARDIQSGRLGMGDRLPPQRYLAEMLGLNLTTVARGYVEAQQRGLVESKVGQGTFVRRAPSAAAPQAAPLRRGTGGDMTLNMPPEPADPSLLAAMQAGLRGLGDVSALLRYQDFGGSAEARRAGAKWLSGRFPGLAGDGGAVGRIQLFPGAQSAILAILLTLTRPGDVVCCEELTFPGFKEVAQQLGLRLCGLAMDEEGIDAGAFAEACERHGPKLLYCNPTLLNPTTTTISERRRGELIDVARRHGVMILEDDAYGALPLAPPPPFAVLAPDITVHVASLAKCMGAGLRIAYLLAPEPRYDARLSSALRVTAVMASPVTAALATAWIDDGTAQAILASIREETAARQKIAADILPGKARLSAPQAFHLWLRLPEGWNRYAFELHLRRLGIGVVVSDVFAATATPPDAVRLCLGGPTDRTELRRNLEILADSLQQPVALSASVI